MGKSWLWSGWKFRRFLTSYGSSLVLKKILNGSCGDEHSQTALKMKFYKLLRCLLILESRAVLQGQTFKAEACGKWTMFMCLLLTEINIHTCRWEISFPLVERRVSLLIWRSSNSISPHLNKWERLCWFSSKAHLAKLPSAVAVSRCLVRV